MVDSNVVPDQQRAERATLVQVRGQIKARITKLCKYLEKAGLYASTEYIDKNLEKIDEALADLPRIQDELKILEPQVDHDSVEENIMDEYEELLVLIRKIKEPNRGAVNDRSTSNSDQRPPSVVSNSVPTDYFLSLPKVEAKKFDGKLEDWRTYRDWFQQTVHNRIGLSDAQRLDYLKRTLTGEALNTINAFKATDDNYSVAWKLLESTYDIEYVLILRHFDLLMETPAMKKNSAEEIRKLLNNVQAQTLAMEALGENVHEWNTPIVHTILKRLHTDTEKEWNRRRLGNKMPKCEDLLTFLREEATRLTPMTPLGSNQNSQSSSSRPGTSKRGDKRVSGHGTQALLTSTPNNSCPMCKGDHGIEKCTQFLALTTTERIKEARKASLCLNCLQGGHKTRFCKSPTCATCQKRHNTLLHLTEEEMNARRASSA